ncbi:hypothetical protein KP78_37260 [Jeotgalibacillus soli]|uniref:Uncharacterized protein n=1 Tax=Jeotgalibacillus soli TaxID=889306 RepID=A0A0C2V4E5_9BACL|nr:hypothetical protein KP78_37260 [Jeotgalibacillus soli]
MNKNKWSSIIHLIILPVMAFSFNDHCLYENRMPSSWGGGII